MEGPHREISTSGRSEAPRAGNSGTPRPASFPRWVAVLFILAVGLILWIGVLSNSSGHLTMPGLDSIAYVAAVVCVAALLAYADRKRSPSGNRRKDK
jgi:hypothetical protein